MRESRRKDEEKGKDDRIKRRASTGIISSTRATNCPRRHPLQGQRRQRHDPRSRPRDTKQCPPPPGPFLPRNGPVQSVKPSPKGKTTPRRSTDVRRNPSAPTAAVSTTSPPGDKDGRVPGTGRARRQRGPASARMRGGPGRWRIPSAELSCPTCRSTGLS